MFNLNLNWLKIIKENLPFFLQTTRRIDWIKALISPFNQIYQEFLIQYQVYSYKIRFNGQVMYLEKILNDKFSPTYGGIYIADGITLYPTYLYRKIEIQPPLYLHRKWKQSISYVVGNFVVHQNKIYKCLVNNIHVQPSLNPIQWQYKRDITFIRRRIEFNIQYDFIVRIPASLTYNVVSLRAIVDFYRLAGKRYKIETY